MRRAVDGLKTVLDQVVVSTFIETEPLTLSHQPPFVNGALVAATTLPARALLEMLLDLELRLGRLRPFHHAPRTIDLDLILYGDQRIIEPGLIVPHPRFRDRRFVLEPLAEIAPDMVDPVTNRTVAELLLDHVSRGHR